jgi:hypothetical protein
MASAAAVRAKFGPQSYRWVFPREALESCPNRVDKLPVDHERYLRRARSVPSDLCFPLAVTVVLTGFRCSVGVWGQLCLYRGNVPSIRSRVRISCARQCCFSRAMPV